MNYGQYQEEEYEGRNQREIGYNPISKVVHRVLTPLFIILINRYLSIGILCLIIMLSYQLSLIGVPIFITDYHLLICFEFLFHL